MNYMIIRSVPVKNQHNAVAVWKIVWSRLDIIL